MLVVLIHIRVKPECAAAFRQATLANARESLREPGIGLFECLQQNDDPCRFVFVEGYRDADAPARHKETRHYQIWRDAVEPMMAEPRKRVLFSPVTAEDADRRT